MLQARLPVLPVLLLCASTLLASEVRAQQELEPPEVCWRKAPRALGVRVTPAAETHLDPSQPLRLTLDDGTFYTVRWTEPVEGDPETVHLPRVAGEGSAGWILEVSGGVCNDNGSVCLTFHATLEVPARGRRRGRRTAAWAQAEPR